MGRVISLVNFKGGVGKTTLSVNLAAGIANRQNENRPYSVLVVDADPQGHASAYMLGEKKYDPGQSLARATALWMDSKLEFLTEDFIVGNKFPNPVFDGSFPNLHLLPPGPDLREVEISGHVRLARMEANIAGRKYYKVIWYLCEKFFTESYDFIIIDCSPSLGLVTINALTAANSVIIPVQCEYFALEGLGKLLNTIKIVQSRLNPELEIEGILLTMYDSRLRLSNQVVEEVKTHFQQMVFDTIIQRNTKLGEAPSFGQTIIMHDVNSKGSVNYLNLAREILQKNNLTKIKEADKKIPVTDEQ